MKLKIIDKYIIAEMMPPFFLGIAGFTLIMLTDIIFTLADLIINRGIPLSAMLKLLVYKLPAIMILAFPVSTLFATAMALGRLSKDNEVTAIRTSGISFERIAVPIIIFSIFVSFSSYITNEFIVPWTNHVSEEIIRQVILKRPPIEVRENVYFKDNANRHFFIRRVHQKTNELEDIMVFEDVEGKFPRDITAEKGRYAGGGWEIENGFIHKYDNEGRLAYEAHFDKMRIEGVEDVVAYTEQKTPQEMNSSELKGMIGTLNKSGINTKELFVDYYMKFSVPLSCLVFALIGIPLSIPPIRSARAWGIVLSIVIAFSFYVFASVMRSFGYGGITPPLIAAFIPQFLFGLFGASLLIREGHFK